MHENAIKLTNFILHVLFLLLGITMLFWFSIHWFSNPAKGPSSLTLCFYWLLMVLYSSRVGLLLPASRFYGLAWTVYGVIFSRQIITSFWKTEDGISLFVKLFLFMTSCQMRSIRHWFTYSRRFSLRSSLEWSFPFAKILTWKWKLCFLSLFSEVAIAIG